MLTAREVKPDIWWVGGIDWNERMFHGYTTEAGITYNAYLIMDEKITLIDTVKPKFADELIQRISPRLMLLSPTMWKWITRVLFRAFTRLLHRLRFTLQTHRV